MPGKFQTTSPVLTKAGDSSQRFFRCVDDRLLTVHCRSFHLVDRSSLECRMHVHCWGNAYLHHHLWDRYLSDQSSFHATYYRYNLLSHTISIRCVSSAEVQGHH